MKSHHGLIAVYGSVAGFYFLYERASNFRKIPSEQLSDFPHRNLNEHGFSNTDRNLRVVGFSSMVYPLNTRIPVLRGAKLYHFAKLNALAWLYLSPPLVAITSLTRGCYTSIIICLTIGSNNQLHCARLFDHRFSTFQKFVLNNSINRKNTVSNELILTIIRSYVLNKITISGKDKLVKVRFLINGEKQIFA
ncbi:hypothetical protein PUN28_004490 [Cardiocondyla obscurior]|uniref:Uncharacterized protein n=1 Tax=Cardiocondyla obscurior TaxID=286306 RepID=A0AAW2GBJ6_9HYME